MNYNVKYCLEEKNVHAINLIIKIIWKKASHVFLNHKQHNVPLTAYQNYIATCAVTPVFWY